MENPQVPIAPLLFLPLVENAFKYVTRDDNRNNHITITLRQTGDWIYFQCRNSCEDRTPPEGGIGLGNVRRRLDLLYKERYSMDIRKTESEYDVTLTIPV